MAETLQGRIEKLARYVAQSNGAMEATVRGFTAQLHGSSLFFTQFSKTIRSRI